MQVLDGGYLLLGDVLAGLDQAIASFPEFVVEKGLAVLPAVFGVGAPVNRTAALSLEAADSHFGYLFVLLGGGGFNRLDSNGFPAILILKSNK